MWTVDFFWISCGSFFEKNKFGLQKRPTYIQSMKKETFNQINTIISKKTQAELIQAMDNVLKEFLKKGDHIEADSDDLADYVKQVWSRKSKFL